MDVRRLAVKGQFRVHFQLSNGMHCIVNEHGVGTVPDLNGPPEFNLEDEFGRAVEFRLENAGGVKGRDGSGETTVLTREQLEQLAGAAAGSAGPVQEHED